MPLQKRLPKYGFTSRIGITTSEVRTSELNAISGELVTIETLKQANLIGLNTKRVKIFLSGDVSKKLVIKGIRVTVGAKKNIEAAGGVFED